MSVPAIFDSLLVPCTDGHVLSVFDIDNTVADTRYRTMAVARAFDAAHHTFHFRDLTLDRVGLDGASTAAAQKLTAEVSSAFQDFWNGPEGFWCGSRFRSDPAIEPTATIVHRAHANGLHVVWLTGRIEALREPTHGWLVQQGLPCGTLVCKPDLSVRTAPYKIQVLREYQRRNRIRFFMTESRRDIAAVQSALPGLCCVLVDFPFQEPADIHPDTLCLRLAASHHP